MAQRIYSLVLPVEDNEVFLDLPDDRRIINVENVTPSGVGATLVRVWIEQTVKV